MTRTFTAKPAAREAIPLFIGIVGPSSSGKTFSALRLAAGIQRVVGGDVHLIDTENKRGLAYSEMFRFQHIVFDPPFGSMDYLAALEQSAAAGAKTIIVDSMSHEHESIGGLIDAHESELDRIAGDDWKKRERMAMLAWQKPKAARRKLLQGITRLNANIIMLFRAKTTSKPIKNREGKVEIVPMGFMPLAGDEFVYEMSLSCLLLPACDGVPTWQSENIGERMAIKLPAQFRSIIRAGDPLTEDLGEALAKWSTAAGENRQAEVERYIKVVDPQGGREAAAKGSSALMEWWSGLSKAQKAANKAALDGELKRLAADADAAAAPGSSQDASESPPPASAAPAPPAQPAGNCTASKGLLILRDRLRTVTAQAGADRLIASPEFAGLEPADQTAFRRDCEWHLSMGAPT